MTMIPLSKVKVGQKVYVIQSGTLNDDGEKDDYHYKIAKLEQIKGRYILIFDSNNLDATWDCDGLAPDYNGRFPEDDDLYVLVGKNIKRCYIKKICHNIK